MFRNQISAAKAGQPSALGVGAAFGTSADAALLHRIGPVEDARVLLIGPHMLGVMCALIRRGCHEVASLRAGDRVEANSADLAIVSAAASRKLVDSPPADIAEARPLAAHAPGLCPRVVYALAPLGSLMVVLDAEDAWTSGPVGGLAGRIGRSLHRHGLAAVRTEALPDGRALLLAERPLIGRLS